MEVLNHRAWKCSKDRFLDLLIWLSIITNLLGGLGGNMWSSGSLRSGSTKVQRLHWSARRSFEDNHEKKSIRLNLSAPPVSFFMKQFSSNFCSCNIWYINFERMFVILCSSLAFWVWFSCQIWTNPDRFLIAFDKKRASQNWVYFQRWEHFLGGFS